MSRPATEGLVMLAFFCLAILISAMAMCVINEVRAARPVPCAVQEGK